jgi:hypothetical protein
MNLRISQNQDNFGGAGLRARRNHGRPGTAALPNRRIGRAVHADAGGHGPPYEKSRSGHRPPLSGAGFEAKQNLAGKPCRAGTARR